MLASPRYARARDTDLDIGAFAGTAQPIVSVGRGVPGVAAINPPIAGVAIAHAGIGDCRVGRVRIYADEVVLGRGPERSVRLHCVIAGLRQLDQQCLDLSIRIGDLDRQWQLEVALHGHRKPDGSGSQTDNWSLTST